MKIDVKNHDRDQIFLTFIKESSKAWATYDDYSRASRFQVSMSAVIIAVKANGFNLFLQRRYEL